MSERRYTFHGGQSGAALSIRITPKAAEDEIAEVLADGTVKVRLKAGPGDGEANAALLSFLARTLDVPAGDLEIVAGSRGHDKLVSILHLDAVTVHHRILAQVRKR